MAALLPHRPYLVRFASALVVFGLLGVPVVLDAQGDARSTPAPVAKLGLELPPELQPFGVLAAERPDADRVARTWASSLDRRLSIATRRALFGAPIAPADATGVQRSGVGPSPVAPSDAVVRVPAGPPGTPGAIADTTRGTALSDLAVDLQTRIEARGERLADDRCGRDARAAFAGCHNAITPTVNVQFALKSGGSVANRFHVNVDFDSQREFDASNHLSVWYEGKPDATIRRVEIGNVAFVAPQSRFLGAAVPAGNYGLLADARLGALQLQAIAAQQKGTVVRDRQFIVGERTLQGGEREIEDWQIEPRRFFFSVDPRLLPTYPSIDILDRGQLAAARAALPDTLRPVRLVVYRLQFGATPQNPNGPRLRVQDEPGRLLPANAQTYDVLREGVDYYSDPSLLWFALVRPINQSNERLAVAYAVRVAGRDTVWITTGGTPDVEFGGREQRANLVWDPNVGPASPAFAREIRSVYRIGGGDLVRDRTQIRIVAGAGNQEKPLAGRFETYLQMLGLSQPTNSAEFDVEQRLWPRRGDPVFNLSAGGGTAGAQAPRVLDDQFLVFPSLRPFASRAAPAEGGLIEGGNPANAAIYTAPGEDLAFGSPRHPPSIYRIVVRYDVEGSAERGALMLGGVQLRRASERIVVDGVTLRRDIDYRMDYELGRLTFVRPDTLFARPRTVSVRYEENPLFAATPTRLAGLAGQWSFPRGQLAFTAVSQAQASAFTRPQLGFERAAATMAGVTGSYAAPIAPLTRLLSRLTGGSSAPVQLQLNGELAASRPEGRERAQAYLESFEGEGGVHVGLADGQWLLSSLPAYGRAGVARDFAGILEPARAAPLAWQTFVTGPDGRALTFSLPRIDPQAQVVGIGSGVPETLLWLTLHPHGCGARDAAGRCSWPITNAPSGRRWRSLRTSLGAGGRDLSLAEQIEFWALVDTATARRTRNPTLVVDVGEISENTLAFAPETLTVRRGSAPDSLFTGRRLAGFDSLDSERDPFTRAFDAAKNDRGLPGDRIDSLIVIDQTAGSPQARRERDVLLCRETERRALPVGDLRARCTAGNGRLDDEDIDLDGTLNIRSDRREEERLLRFVVDLANPAQYARVGQSAQVVDTVDGRATTVTKHWVLIRLPFGAPNERIGDVSLRRVRGLRLTMIGGPALSDRDPSTVALARMRFVAAPWVKRADGPVTGAAGDRRGPGFAIVSVIGTADRDSSRGFIYEPPPGVGDQAETVGSEFQTGARQINERSLRILAGGLEPYHRVEAYHRFPAGQQSFMGYRELRLWARGRGAGWTPSGELQFFVRIGRDEHNFYLYRTPVNSGSGQGAWLPEIRVDFRRLHALRERLEREYLLGGPGALACTGSDSLLLAASGLPLGGASRRRAVCDGGYIAYSVEPGVTPPNLAAVQELAVGVMRIPAPGAAPLLPADTVELWVDDIRLARAVDDIGVAGHLSMDLIAGDFAAMRFAYTRRGANFRQIGESPSFVDEGALDMSATMRLDRMLPRGIGLALPLTVTHTRANDDPVFLARTDIRARGVAGLRAPSTGVTTWQLAARRTDPVRHPILGPLVNNLVVSSTLVSGDARSEYQVGRTRQLTMGVDYALASAPRAVRLPFGGANLRWSPTQFRVTSALARGSDDRDHFFKPAPSVDDIARRTGADTRVWRTGTSLQLEPSTGVTARWDLFSLRDLRRYGAGDPFSSRLADEARGQLGFERERTMQLALSLVPTMGEWLKPRLDVGTSYGMLRDPNFRARGFIAGSNPERAESARDLMRFIAGSNAESAERARDLMRFIAGSNAESTERARDLAEVIADPMRDMASADIASPLRADEALPRRLTAQQNVTAGVAVDLARATGSRDSAAQGVTRRLVRALAPVDLTYSRSVLSAFDDAAFAPPLGFQLAVGGTGGFRRVRGTPAAAAGLSETIGATTSIALPLGASLSNRFRRIGTTSWATRLDDSQSAVDGVQTVFPDASLRWSWRPGATAATPLLTGVTGSVGFVSSAARVTLPGFASTLESPSAFRTTRVRTLPVQASLAWGVGALSTAAGFTHTQRTDSLPGSIARGTATELSADAGRVFRIPQSWGLGLRNDVRGRVTWQESRARTVVEDMTRGTTGRLADHGRRALSLNADTDVSETLLFTLQGSHVVTTDRNLDRKLTQLVLSAVVQIQFNGGGK